MPGEYKIYKDGGYVRECGRCSSPAPLTKTEWRDMGKLSADIPKDRASHEYLCQFCYETSIGNILGYRHYSGDVQTLAMAMAQSFNLLAKKR